MKKRFTLVIIFLGLTRYSMGSLKKPRSNVSLYPVTMTCLPTDMLRLITHQIGVISNVAEARKHFAALATSCKTLNTFLKKEKQECLKQLFLAVQRDNDVHVKNLTNHLISMMRTEDIFFRADKDGNTLMHHVALNSHSLKNYDQTANYRILVYLENMYHEHLVSKTDELNKAIKKGDIALLKKLLTKVHPDSGIRLNMIPNKKGQRPSDLTEKCSMSKRYLIYLIPLKFFSDKKGCQEPTYDGFGEIDWGGYPFRSRNKSCDELHIKTFTPLMFACLKNNEKAVKELLLAGANPNIQSDHERHFFVPFSTALMMTKKVGIQKLLLKYGAQPNLTNIYNETALIRALKKKPRVDSIELLLKSGVDVNIPSLKPRHSSISLHQMSALEYFWKEVKPNPTEIDWKILKLLAQNVTHKTPFEDAILDQNSKKVKKIVSNTKRAIRKLGKLRMYIEAARESALIKAYLENMEQITKLIGQKRFSEISKLKESQNEILASIGSFLRNPLWEIYELENKIRLTVNEEEKSKLLMRKDILVHEINGELIDPETPYIKLARIDTLLNSDLLAPNRLRGDFRNVGLLSSLFNNAKYFEKDKLIKYVTHLIELRANLFLKPIKAGYSKKPLFRMMLIRGERGLALLKLILQKVEHDNLVSILWRMYGDFEKAKVLLEHGADPNKLDNSGNFVLAYRLNSRRISLEEKKESIKLFQKYGADFNLKNERGLSIIDIEQKRAEKRNDYGVLNFLLECQNNCTKS